MFDRIIAYSIHNKMVIGLMVMGLIAVGIFSMKNLPIDALPDITNNQVQIITTSPNLGTEEVELFITYPIELAMKSIPEIVEMRSVSRFGLSLVTIVFQESTDIYWARAQIVERLREAEEQIPAGFGRPELAPISTGLGEIYQYTLTAEPGYEEHFDAMELRSIQDWIIVPQLLSVKGVAEVNTLGGVLKEYEVAINPNRLKSMDVTMAEVFKALQRNNENTGGAYIDKKPYAYFIRSIGMVSSLEDISKIVVKTSNNIPILVRDVAEVQFGSSVRYGATTKDGKGEAVNGMVMMLKGANSAEIVSLVKEQMKQVETIIPEGVKIEVYLDRSKLVNRAIATVRTNLIEGALIVLFILVLLIGNWRAGLIVASVIPLALLFAVSMMRLFGVSGNLMSLGAIDFGLIVDGAVIIVEAIVHRIYGVRGGAAGKRLTVEEMNQSVYEAASDIRSSAAFGEIIILIVYLPILALVGIEGKMFSPMAKTVAFAILGAFILSLTYVPMMSALCLSKNTKHKENFSDKIIQFFQRLYNPFLNFALRFKWPVLCLSVLMFSFSIFGFTKLGGEFIPTLSEGDIATHVMIPPGSSLDQEIHSTTKAEQLLLDNFPEIEQIVSKIGSAEVPTDPMPMEVADVIIIMKDKSEWTSASTREEMYEKMEKVLDDLPGVTTEFSQPIQMRFNELMTGVRSDVGIKIFGDDVDRLVAYGDQLVAIVQSVNGVQDARAEAVSGLPQITVKYNKDKLALYGLNVADLNLALSTGFAGSKAGVVYDAEKKYDLVVRLAEEYRQDLNNINNLFVSLPSGNQIPLEQVADITFERGPAQISREDGKRRIIVGFNVRDRDVESVVDEIEKKVADQIKLPIGYYTSYAGQFENLKRAKERLGIAVPLALALIFILLFMTFKSVKQAILIFTAIPLSAIGGVFALWLRDMPFSISAGVGFIALFGVAVLNGIVLIACFNQLKSEGMEDIIERIKTGTSIRLRPVIMTASVASLGFLPMALSSSAGAEVQKPLATVVIGGLITATLLTLIVLPILYYFSEVSAKKKSGSTATATAVVTMLVMSFLGLFCSNIVEAQEKLSLEQAIDFALESSPEAKLQQLEISRQEQLAGGQYFVPKAELEGSFGQVNSRAYDHAFSISQKFNPFAAKAAKKLSRENIAFSKGKKELAELQLKYEIRKLWNECAFHKAERQVLIEQENNYQKISNSQEQRVKYGDISRRERSRTLLESGRVERALREREIEILSIEAHLAILLGKEVEFEESNFEPLAMTTDSKMKLEEHPLLQSIKQNGKIAEGNANLLQAKSKPDFTIGYFVQSFKGFQTVENSLRYYNNIPRFQGFNLGMSFPVFRKAYKAQGQAAETNALIVQANVRKLQLELDAEILKWKRVYEEECLNLEYFRETGIPLAEEIVSDATISYQSGDIDYIFYLDALMTEYNTRLEYLEAVHHLNLSVIELQFLLNQ